MPFLPYYIVIETNVVSGVSLRQSAIRSSLEDSRFHAMSLRTI